MLLTQSQVSVIITASIGVLITLLLFLPGYYIQQRTITSLGNAIRPIVPRAPESTQKRTEEQTELLRSRFFNPQDGRIVFTDPDADIHRSDVKVDWTRLAHAQLVRRHHDVCNAIMILADFHRLRSPARRLLLFPREWANERAAFRGDISDPFLDSTRRLLRMAARRYHVELRPVEAFGGNIRSSWSSTLQYSLASAFALSDYDRLLVMEGPGMVLEAEPLDALLAFTESAPLAMLHDTYTNDSIHAQDLYLIKPSSASYAEASIELNRLIPSLVDTTKDIPLSSLVASTEPLLLASSSTEHALIRSVAALHDVRPGFNQTEFLTDVAYMRYSDPKLPGPEYVVPWEVKRAARPQDKDADWTWTRLYTEFAQKRVEVCGLDLETWRE